MAFKMISSPKEMRIKCEMSLIFRELIDSSILVSDGDNFLNKEINAEKFFYTKVYFVKKIDFDDRLMFLFLNSDNCKWLPDRTNHPIAAVKK